MRFLIGCTCGARFWRASVCTTHRNGAIKTYDCPKRKRAGEHRVQVVPIAEQIAYNADKGIAPYHPHVSFAPCGADCVV